MQSEKKYSSKKFWRDVERPQNWSLMFILEDRYVMLGQPESLLHNILATPCLYVSLLIG